jgi:RNA polymerase sigma-70 factor, ECF subfamily
MTATSAATPEPFAPLGQGGCVLPAANTTSDPADPDVALMLEVAAGSETAFAALVRRHQNPLLNFFVRMGASSDGEDLVQETFVRLFRYRQQYQPAARFATFLYHLARHVLADRGRKIVRLERLATEYQNEVQLGAYAGAGRSGDGVDVEAALDLLSPKLREVVVLNIYQGLRYQEVADVLEIPLGTVKSRLNLAFAALKEILHEH